MHILFIFILTAAARAGSPPPVKTFETSKPTIVAVNPETSLKDFDPNEYNLVQGVQPASSEVLSKDKRDLLFKACGFSKKDLKKFDDFAKDLLYLRARHSTLEQLKQYYPALSAVKLEKLKGMVNQ